MVYQGRTNSGVMGLNGSFLERPTIIIMGWRVVCISDVSVNVRGDHLGIGETVGVRDIRTGSLRFIETKYSVARTLFTSRPGRHDLLHTTFTSKQRENGEIYGGRYGSRWR